VLAKPYSNLLDDRVYRCLLLQANGMVRLATLGLSFQNYGNSKENMLIVPRGDRSISDDVMSSGKLCWFYNDRCWNSSSVQTASNSHLERQYMLCMVYITHICIGVCIYPSNWLRNIQAVIQSVSK
jgi:hypothetical protein